MRDSISARDYEQAFRPAERGLVIGPAHHAAMRHLAIAPGQRVLDLGCGTGPLARLLTQAGARVVGIDHSQAALAVARAAVPSQRFVRGDIAALPFPDSCFGAVAALGVLGWVSASDLARALAECARVLQPGGMLLICTGRRLNAIGSLALRTRGSARGHGGNRRSFLYGAATYRRALRRLGLVVEDWVAWESAPDAWWTRLARPFFAARWITARKQATA